MKPILSFQNQPFPQVFKMVLDFHLQEGATILDTTPGMRYSWKKYEQNIKYNDIQFFKEKEYNISYLYTPIEKLFDLPMIFDALFFDPPYIFGTKGKTTDPREEDYGAYQHDFNKIREIFETANTVFPSILKPDGKLFVKYSDVFSLTDHSFYLCCSIWPNILSNFHVIDHYIIQHHHISPTAWQVKDRPCSILNYTYLTVFKKNESERRSI